MEEGLDNDQSSINARFLRVPVERLSVLRVSVERLYVLCVCVSFKVLHLSVVIQFINGGCSRWNLKG